MHRESVSLLREVSTPFEQMVVWLLIFNEECHTSCKNSHTGCVLCLVPSFCLCSSGTCNQCIRALTRLAELISCLRCICLGVCLFLMNEQLKILILWWFLCLSYISCMYRHHGREKKHTATIKTSNSVRLLRLCVECLCSTSCSKESIMLMA